MPRKVKEEELDSLPDPNDHDEIVREIDVFVTPELSDHLYLLQYPLQHGEGTPPSSARIKPRHNMIEIEKPILNIGKNGGLYDFSHRTFASQTIPVESHLCLGKLTNEGGHNSSLHLVPLTRISQMRPTFRHMDQKIHSEPEDDEIDEPEVKPIVFQRKESDRAIAARKSSYAYKKMSEDGEEWHNLTILDRDSQEYKQTMDHLLRLKSTTKKVIRENDAVGEDPNLSFVQSLKYFQSEPERREAVGTGMDEKVIVAKIVKLMQLGMPMPFSIIRAQFSDDITDATLLNTLDVCSVIVRGNFCLNSKYMPLPKELQIARTFILLILNRDGFAKRSCLESIKPRGVNVYTEQWQMLLTQVAKRELNGWQLKVSDDRGFPKKFPQHSKLHGQYWQRQSKRFRTELHDYDRGLSAQRY